MNQDFLAKMSQGDKALGIGSLVVLVALFLPWYGWDIGPASASVDGFTSWGWLTVIGLIAVVAFYVVRNFMADSVKLELPVTDAQAYMIGGGLELLGVVIFWLAYHADSGNTLFGNFGVRFGLFIGLVGAVVTIAAGYMKQSEPAVAATPSTAPPSAPPATPPQSEPPAV